VSLRAFVPFAFLGALGCADCRARRSSADAAPSAGRPHELAVRPPPVIEPLKWQAHDEARGIGVPAGCQLELPIRHAKLPAADVRFIAPRSELGELALALAAPGTPNVSKAGLLVQGSTKVRALPWFELDRPPAFDRTPKGWVAAFPHASGDKNAPLLWSEYRDPSPLAGGDQLAVADVLCRGETCAVLTTLARAAAAPGATVHLVAPGLAATRVDVEADPAVPWQPLSIVFFDGTEARITLKTPTAVAFWSVTKERATKLSELKTEFGVYDASSAERPLVAAPGASVSEPCKADQFPIRILGPGGKVHVVRSQAAPESLLIRALDRGALVLWVAPITCSNADRTVVYAALVDAHGVPTGSVMSVADAIGFAAATRGSELALWLRTKEGLSFVRARCGTNPERRD
jgi:hypothetical protein